MGIRYIGKMREFTIARPLNMEGFDPYFADNPHRVRCPHCSQFHLRARYCQALDPLNKPVDAPVDAKEVVDVDASTETDDERRKRLKRERQARWWKGR